MKGSEVSAVTAKRLISVTAGAALLGTFLAWRAGHGRPPPYDSPADRHDISSLRGSTLPRLPMDALADRQPGRLPDYGLIVFVQPRCLASRRLMALIGNRLDAARSAVPLILVLAAEPDEARRLAATYSARGRLARVPPSLLPEVIRESIPCAVMLAPGRLVRHAGGMSDATAITRFIEACGDKRLRQWFNGWPA